jgi:hypothetical protein
LCLAVQTNVPVAMAITVPVPAAVMVESGKHVSHYSTATTSVYVVFACNLEYSNKLPTYNRRRLARYVKKLTE